MKQKIPRITRNNQKQMKIRKDPSLALSDEDELSSRSTKKNKYLLFPDTQVFTFVVAAQGDGCWATLPQRRERGEIYSWPLLVSEGSWNFLV